MDVDQPMDGGQGGLVVHHLNEKDILAATITHLEDQRSDYNCVGSSVDIYQFSRDIAFGWNQGEIFNASDPHLISFDGGMFKTSYANAREAAFLVNQPTRWNAVEGMMWKSLNLKNRGILRPYLVAYNGQISQVVSAYRVLPTHSFQAWLDSEKAKLVSAPTLTSIPPEVKQIIRIAYQAVEAIRAAGSTSDALGNLASYHMVDNMIKIDPMCIRDRGDEEDDMRPRNDFGDMILSHIHPVWRDEELIDFVDLLKNPTTGEDDVLGAPVLLLPETRDLLYHKFAKTNLEYLQEIWMQANGNPQQGWMERARNTDTCLKDIIDERRVQFLTDYTGAFHFARVVAGHYAQHFNKTPEGRSGGDVKGRVDSLLKEVLPRLLSRRYNAQYHYEE